MSHRSNLIKCQSQIRKKQGSILSLTLSLLCFAITLSIGLFQICLLIGGNSQFKNSVNAGSLAVVKDAMLKPSLRLSRNDDPHGILSPLQEPYDGVNLKNFNRMAAVELLVELNEAAMETEGSSTRDSLKNAQELNDTIASLARKFSSNLIGLAPRIAAFEKMVLSNQVTMLGTRTIPAVRDWDSAYMHADTASNIYMAQRQIPDGVSSQIPFSTIDIKGTRRTYISGYRQIDTGVNRQVRRPRQTYFFPLRPPLQPHQVSNNDFDRAKRPPLAIDRTYAIPNSFQARGNIRVSLANQFMTYAACSVAEGMDEGYAASIPGGFLRIENKTTGFVNLAQLLDTPLALPIKKRILQRLWQIDPEFEAASLDRVLPNRLRPNEKALVSAQEERLLNLSARFVQPDGNKSLEPMPVDGKLLQWIPSTGYNGLLAVLEINERAGR